MKRISVYVFRWIALAFATCTFHQALAQGSDSAAVFRVGIFDRSSGEFADGSPQAPVRFYAGHSHIERDWFAAQPAASLNAGGSGKEENDTAPRAIEFSIDHAPVSAYRFHASLLIESTGVPALRVVINGISGTFYLHPSLDFAMGDENNPPQFSHADVIFTFPGSYLRRGANTITLQAVEETPTPEATLNYDAIELDQESQSTAAGPPPTAIIEPTVFYQYLAGHLEETVDIFIRNSRSYAQGDYLDLEIAGKHWKKTLQGHSDFGEEKIEFEVPEFPSQTLVRLAWTEKRVLHRQESTISPDKKWTILVVPHSHLDVGYSDYQAKVAAVQSRAIDEAIDLAEKHPGFSYSVDGEWPLDQFMRTRSPSDRMRAIEAIRRQQLYIPAQYANLLTGFPTAETLIRSLYPSANFSRLHNLPFNYANITDVPSYSWSYPSILAAAGIHDFLAGSNSRNVRAPVLLQGRLNETSPMWWVGPDGEKVLFWYSRGYQQMRKLFSLPPSLSAARQTMPLFLLQYMHPGYLADSVILYGTQHENTDLFPQQAEFVQQWNAIYAFPHLRYSGIRDALEGIASQFGNALPTIRGDGGPYWEDGIAADALYGAMERNNESRAPAAEQLETIASLADPHLAPDKAGLDQMWSEMVLMDEHTFASSDSVSDPNSVEATQQIAFKDSCATRAGQLADWMIRNSIDSLANSISSGPGSLVVFNTLNWNRDGTVTLDLKRDQEVVDSVTDRRVPYEVLRSDGNLSHVRLIVADIPAVGYRVFRLRKAKQPPASPETTHELVLNSRYYRVELAPESGAVRSIFDKELKRELVNRESPYRFGQYIYVTGGDQEPNSLLEYRVVSPKPDLEVHPARHGRLLSVIRTPDGVVARMESSAINTPGIATEIRLFDNRKEIEFVEDVDKTEVYSKEGVYFAFPFAMNRPQFQYEIQNGVVDPETDMYPGAGHEWFSVQHWVSAQQDGVSGTVIPLDSSLVTLGDINRGEWPTTFGKRTGTIFSYVMNNYWDTNYRAGQGGHFQFRFLVTSAPHTDPISLSRMGWEEITPLEAGEIKTEDKAINTPRSLDGTQGHFLEINDSALLLEAWKPAEDGHGTILRFLDLGGKSRKVSIRLPLLTISQAWLTDAVERNQEQLAIEATSALSFQIRPHAIITIRIITPPRD